MPVGYVCMKSTQNRLNF